MVQLYVHGGNSSSQSWTAYSKIEPTSKYLLGATSILSIRDIKNHLDTIPALQNLAADYIEGFS